MSVNIFFQSKLIDKQNGIILCEEKNSEKDSELYSTDQGNCGIYMHVPAK